MSVQVCPGCQGRNSPQAETCEWCGRPFDGRARGFSLRWWHLATALLFAVVPKGFFPVQDTGLIVGVTEAPQTISFAGLGERHHEQGRNANRGSSGRRLPWPSC